MRSVSEAKTKFFSAKRSEAKRIRFASLFFALMRIRNANLDPCIQTENKLSNSEFQNLNCEKVVKLVAMVGVALEIWFVCSGAERRPWYWSDLWIFTAVRQTKMQLSLILATFFTNSNSRIKFDVDKALKCLISKLKKKALALKWIKKNRDIEAKNVF